MTERKGRREPPKVEVIRRPGAPGEATKQPAMAGTVAPRPGPVPSRAVRPSGTRPVPAAAPFRRPAPAGPPPTQEEIHALARKEHVPARIAKGELDGKMKCRVWRKLHPEEARRFDGVYELMEKHPGLSLADAFGVLESGLPVEDFQRRRASVQSKAQVKEARQSVPPEAVNAFVDRLVRERIELAIVLAERTLIDLIRAVEPVAFQLEQAGKLEKLKVVLLGPKPAWEALAQKLERDPLLAQSPAPIAKEPHKRPVLDARPFLDHLGKPIELWLRNGFKLEEALRAVGPFDLLVGQEGAELLVPLHALVRWSALSSSSAAPGAPPGG